MVTSATRLSITKIQPFLGAVIDGVDLTEPVDDATFAAIRDAFETFSVLVFRSQALTDEQQVAFSQRFGPLETTVSSPVGGGSHIADLSNVDKHGALIPPDDRRMIYHAGNQMWHSDSSFKPVPALASLLSGRLVPPEGGETEFASMRAAYASLPADMKKRIDDLVVEHSIVYSRSLIAPDLFDDNQRNALPPVRHALVRTNPVNGCKAFYVGSHASHIIGWSITEGRALLQELTERATQPDFRYLHVWQPNDLVIWDNRCVLHRGRPWDGTRYRRVMHRTTVAGDGPSVGA